MNYDHHCKALDRAPTLSFPPSAGYPYSSPQVTFIYVSFVSDIHVEGIMRTMQEKEVGEPEARKNKGHC